VEVSHAASHTDHDVWRVYAEHFDASILVLDRHSVSPLLLFQIGQESLAEPTDFPATGNAATKS
jgi:hypothetical protein